MPQIMHDITNWFVYLTLSAAFFKLGMSEDKKDRYLVYYAIAQFWLFLVLTYVFNEFFDLQIIMHKVFIAISLTFVCSLLLYISYWRK